MDMLNHLQNLVSGEEDAGLRREVQAAYPVEEHPTPPDLLLDRLLAKVEATPQLAAISVEESATAMVQSDDVEPMPAASAQKTGSWLSRFKQLRKARHGTRRQRQPVRAIPWETYHENVEYCMRHVRPGNATKPLI